MCRSSRQMSNELGISNIQGFPLWLKLYLHNFTQWLKPVTLPVLIHSTLLQFFSITLLPRLRLLCLQNQCYADAVKKSFYQWKIQAGTRDHIAMTSVRCPAGMLSRCPSKKQQASLTDGNLFVTALCCLYFPCPKLDHLLHTSSLLLTNQSIIIQCEFTQVPGIW